MIHVFNKCKINQLSLKARQVHFRKAQFKNLMIQGDNTDNK